MKRPNKWQEMKKNQNQRIILASCETAVLVSMYLSSFLVKQEYS